MADDFTDTTTGDPADPPPSTDPSAPPKGHAARKIQRDAEHAQREQARQAKLKLAEETPPGVSVNPHRAPSPVTHDPYLEDEDVVGEP